MRDSVRARAREILELDERALHRRADRLFARLMVFQWLLAIGLALVASPRTWAGARHEVHVHVWAAVLLGTFITWIPLAVLHRYPGTVLSRHTVALGQMLMGALLIHVTGGRIETHFHVFGSLAFLAFYRDWRVLLTGSLVVAVDHSIRGTLWPQSAFGVLTASSWRWIEHVLWVVFTDVFLLWSCRQSRAEMASIAEAQARLESTNELVEAEIRDRTAELERTNGRLREEIAERDLLRSQRDDMQRRLAQGEKLEAVGQLAAGIAHEINTPAQFVNDNTRFLQQTFQKIEVLLTTSRDLASLDPGSAEMDAAVELIRSEAQRIRLDFLLEELPGSFDDSIDGLDRVASIVRALKAFSDPGSGELELVDLNEAVRNTLTVTRNEWKHVAEVVTDFDEDLPHVPCTKNEINQVVLSLVVNAAHSIAEARNTEPGRRCEIRIRTRAVGDRVEISVEDSGTGIPHELHERIFEPFFTTKELGRGTGQGLAVAHSILRKHGGDILLESEVGRGATFTLHLPLCAEGTPAPTAA